MRETELIEELGYDRYDSEGRNSGKMHTSAAEAEIHLSQCIECFFADSRLTSKRDDYNTTPSLAFNGLKFERRAKKPSTARMSLPAETYIREVALPCTSRKAIGRYSERSPANKLAVVPILSAAFIPAYP